MLALSGWLLTATDCPAAELKSRLDIPYVAGGEAGAKRSLDAYWLPNQTRQPVMIYIHGGGWRAGDKRNVARKPQAFADHGFAFVSVNYRLHPEADFRVQAADVARAIKHVVDKAGDVGGDPQRIYLMGHSAGAHLAALVATDEQYLQAVDLPLTTIQGVVLLDGAGYDIPKRLATASGAQAESVFEAVFGKDEASHRAASPITHVAANKGIPPFLILPIASRLDSGMQSDDLAAKLKSAGVEAKVVRCPNQTHGSINQQFGTADHLATTECFEFLKARQAELSQAVTPPAAAKDE
jgi:acetyl esterase/lipase